jgi:NADH:ubiquinone oxidoreductase subunit F (NADH-binding)
LIEAIEGHRAEPRNKPPFPGVIGLYQKPTVINNVETFTNAPQILARGIDWYKSAGQGGSRGLKFVGVSGHCAKPGIYEVPMGIPMREVLFDYAGGVRGGRQLKASFVGLFAGFDGGRAARFQSTCGCGFDAGFRRDRGLRRHDLHAGHGSECCAFLSQ